MRSVRVSGQEVGAVAGDEVSGDSRARVRRLGDQGAVDGVGDDEVAGGGGGAEVDDIVDGEVEGEGGEEGGKYYHF